MTADWMDRCNSSQRVESGRDVVICWWVGW